MRCLLLLLLLLLLLAAPAGAQTGDDWTWLEGAVGGAALDSDAFGPSWSVQPGVSVRLASPAYGGWVRASLAVVNVEDRAETVPSFLMLAPSLGWGVDLPLVAGAALRVGPEVGVATIRFEDEDIAGTNFESETELLVGAFAHLDVPLAAGIGVWAEGGVARLAFATPVTLPHVGGGVRVRATTPRALRRLLE